MATEELTPRIVMATKNRGSADSGYVYDAKAGVTLALTLTAASAAARSAGGRL